MIIDFSVAKSIHFSVGITYQVIRHDDNIVVNTMTVFFLYLDRGRYLYMYIYNLWIILFINYVLLKYRSFNNVLFSIIFVSIYLRIPTQYYLNVIPCDFTFDEVPMFYRVIWQPKGWETRIHLSN